MAYLNAKAPHDSYAYFSGARDRAYFNTPEKLLEHAIYPMAKKLDEEMAELRAEIAKLSDKVATPRSNGSTPRNHTPKPRRQRKTRKSRK